MKFRTIFTASILTSAVLAGPALAEDLKFSLINDTDTPITAFHVSPASTNDWEHNLMSGNALPGGYNTDIYIQDGLTTCIYDIRATFSDGETLEDYNLDLCDMGSYTFY